MLYGLSSLRLDMVNAGTITRDQEASGRGRVDCVDVAVQFLRAGTMGDQRTMRVRRALATASDFEWTWSFA